MMIKNLSLQKKIYQQLKKLRFEAVYPYFDQEAKTVLDIGCEDAVLYRQLNSTFHVTLADIDPQRDDIEKQNVISLTYEDNVFDIVICQEVLEHTTDPVQALKELKRVARRQLIITVPNEPIFSLFRGLVWENEHLWAVTYDALKAHLGSADVHKKIVLNRYTLAIWNF